MNFDWVTDRLGVGTEPDNPDDVKALSAAGFTHIINCRDDRDDMWVLRGTPFENRYLWNGTADWIPLSGQHKPVDWFQIGVAYALPRLASPTARLYVHCKAGANRSATMAYAILRALGLTTAECFAIIDTHRLIAVPGLIECGWWRDADAALKTLGFVD